MNRGKFESTPSTGRTALSLAHNAAGASELRVSKSVTPRCFAIVAFAEATRSFDQLSRACSTTSWPVYSTTITFSTLCLASASCRATAVRNSAVSSGAIAFWLASEAPSSRMTSDLSRVISPASALLTSLYSVSAKSPRSYVANTAFSVASAVSLGM